MNLHIRASGNVSSISDGGVGIYTVNLLTNIDDVNYSVATGASGNETTAPSNNCGMIGINNLTTSSFRVIGGTAGDTANLGVQADLLNAFCVIFR